MPHQFKDNEPAVFETRLMTGMRVESQCGRDLSPAPFKDEFVSIVEALLDLDADHYRLPPLSGCGADLALTRGLMFSGQIISKALDQIFVVHWTTKNACQQGLRVTAVSDRQADEFQISLVNL